MKKRNYLLVFLIALFIYGISAGTQINKQSNTPQYIYLANSFLHGKVYLNPVPKNTFDLIFFDGKWYVPGGITPAILILPFVAIFGVHISDVLYGVILGALNVSLMYTLLCDIVNSKKIQVWLTILFGLGTVHWWVSSVGSVWFNAHLSALLFMILFVRATLKDKGWQAGLYFSLAILARPPIIFSVLFYIFHNYLKENNLISTIKRTISFGVMLGSGLTLMMTYNYLRFNNPLDFGYSNVQGNSSLTSAYIKTGGFNPSYMPCNIYVSLFGLPNIPSNPLPSVNQACQHLKNIGTTFESLSSFFNPIGMSIFLTTPAFLLIFQAKERSIIPIWAGMIGILLILWMYHTTGWVQFGYRYSLDITVFLFMLLGYGINKIGYLEKSLITLSVVMGATGLYLMYYMTFGLIWYEMFIDILQRIYHFVF